MKFARYLEDTQIPEWKRAYVDYRRLKKCIAQMVSGKPVSGLEPSATASASDFVASESLSGPSRGHAESAVHAQLGISEPLNRGVHPRYGSQMHSPPLIRVQESPGDLHAGMESSSDVRPSPDSKDGGGSDGLPKRSRPTIQPPAFSSPSPSTSVPRFTLANMRRRGPHATTSIPPDARLDDIFIGLTPAQRRFFEVLNQELNKVDEFYIERERDALILSSLLKEQLQELQGHRDLYHSTEHVITHGWPLPFELFNPIRYLSPGPRSDSRKSPSVPDLSSGRTRDSEQPGARKLDPEEYHRNKKKLKKALLEHYRGMELLNNYRILNLTGFRKGLKKFEKVTKISVQNLYTKEKVETCAFSSATKLQQMIREVEDLYTQFFGNGNRKEALNRLRATIQHRAHHSKTFRSGLLIGLGLPALVQGVYFSFQREARAAIPAWNALLQVYEGFFVVVLFSLLITLNLIAWSRARINYVFIFELDVRTAIDPREFAEIPSLLFLTLSYAFWLSFSRVGSIPPTTWPLAWLVFSLVLILAPLPIYTRPSRWWLVRKVGKLLASGTSRVEFADFWMGDQLCSLTFSLSTLWTFGCAYGNHWLADTYTKCGVSEQWGVPFALSALPAVLRLIQCIKRYEDSGLYTHLINGGKYFSSIIYYVFYFLWRAKGARLEGYPFVLFWIFASIMSICSAGWDLLMDWSVLDPKARYKFLRSDLIYTNSIPFYYFAIIYNVIVRFAWIGFLLYPSSHFVVTTRSFLFAILEVVRRVEWNLLRLENEHIGNMDQYRVTREVPLPYSFRDNDENDEDSENDGRSERSATIRGRGAGPRVKASVHLPTIDNSGQV